MITSELMLCDKVQLKYTDPDHPNPIIQIISIYGESVLVCNENNCKQWKIGIQDIEPIPLTANLLEKNGFKRHNRYRYLHIDNYCKVCVSIAPRVEIDGMDLGEPPINVSIEGALFDINMTISAIHELQRALRCCGLWDLANNFKID